MSDGTVPAPLAKTWFTHYLMKRGDDFAILGKLHVTYQMLTATDFDEWG